MDKAILVNLDLERGSELVDVLEQKKIKVSVALWAVLSEYGDWRMIISARQFDLLGTREAYGLLHETLAPAGFTPATTPPVMIFRMNDPFIRELRRIYGKTKSVEGMRPGGQLIADRFVEDGYIYRIS